MNLKAKKKVIQTIVLSLVINGAIPVVVYNFLVDHYSSFVSLLIATLIPLGDNLFHVVKYRKADAFGLFMLTGFVLSLLAFVLGGNERLILLRESMVTGLLGLIFIASLFFAKPLIYHFAIRFSSNDETEKKGQFEKNWEVPYFRFVLRIMTAIWGIALLGEAIVKVILIYELSISVFLAVSQLIFYGVIGAAILFTIVYRKYAKTRLDLINNQ
ncbi:VC0807 family protein [Neobacillus drentensis]|uniref:VC0807 family protein n=1 Tax=Neobacillus drentensis TaxID=220684 RepID=UPI002855156C|nr:VC0807 family protein [Neobacillus drentensis]MDR7240715.1 putative membrane protein [Neobacillus drentensis]